MATAATHRPRFETGDHVLYLALELAVGTWKLGFTTGVGQRPRERMIPAGNTERLLLEIGHALQRFDLPADTRVLSCYEAGRDGFWLHRFLHAAGVHNHVVDSSSIEVNRRARRSKSDRLDLSSLLRLLIRYQAGETRVWSVLNVPSVEAEDARHLHRELTTLKRDRTRIINRIKGLLATQGLRLQITGHLGADLERARLWDGSPLPRRLHARLLREATKLHLLNQQIREVEALRRAALKDPHDVVARQVRQLLALRGIGTNSAWSFVTEFFAWRQFRNRREVGALAGLTPTPYQSGTRARELGISRAGNRHIRYMAIEIAWGWLRFQPDSALSRWYERRFGHGGSRLRRIGIVALARKLLIELWRYLETGVPPEGATLNA